MVINHFPVKLLDSDAFPSDTVRNLGVIFDSDFNFRQHISQVCKSCFICDLCRIRCHISISTAKTISTALINSRLDYCNSLLNNIAKRNLAKLQLVQNCLARFSRRLGFLHHYHYLNSDTGFLFVIELILSCPLLYIMLYLHNNHPTWLGTSDHQFHNLLCLKQNLTWVNMLSLLLCLGSGMNSPSL